MKCPTCESCEYAQYCGATEIMRKCERHNKKVELTNEEWLRSCTTEQLADALRKIFMTMTFCFLCPEGDVCDVGYKCKYSDGKKIKDWVEWLKAKHE